MQARSPEPRMTLADLPDDVIARIAVHLNQWSLLQFSAVCRKFANVVVCASPCPCCGIAGDFSLRWPACLCSNCCRLTGRCSHAIRGVAFSLSSAHVQSFTP